MPYEKCLFHDGRFKYNAGEEYKFCCKKCYKRFVGPMKSKYGLPFIKQNAEQVKQEVLEYERVRAENGRAAFIEYCADVEVD